MVKKLTALFIPVEGIGHVNACIGIAEPLIDAGHRVVFLMTSQWRGKLTAKYGIEEILYENPNDGQEGDNPALYFAQVLRNAGVISPNGPLDTQIAWQQNFLPFVIKLAQGLDKIVDQTLKTIKPDVILMDQVVTLSSVERSGIPWVWVCSYNPLFQLYSYNQPPAGSGLPTKGYRREWKAFQTAVDAVTYDVWKPFNDYIMGQGLQSLPTNQFFCPSPHLFLYPFPTELDYTDLRPVPPKCYQLDNMMRRDKGLHFEIPDLLLNKPGKLIYVALGSMVSSDLDNMRRLIAILGKSRHRFIVSKGPLHDKYDLPANMWGQQYVPQIQILPEVDLVVTHGGNNTVTETLYFGKPMVVLPVFADQFDNAQRLDELGYGVRLDTYKCTKLELLGAIDKLLDDKDLNYKLIKMSQRIQSENRIANVPRLIEQLCSKK